MTTGDPDQYDLRTVDEIDYDSLCESWEWEDPETVNIATRICDVWAIKTPNRIALYWENEERVERSFTFQDIADLSNQCGNALSSSDVGRGDKVALYLPSCPELLAVMLGSHKVGAVNIPLYQLFGPEGLETRLRPTTPDIIFTDLGGLETLDRLPAEHVADQVVLITGDTVRADIFDDNDLSITLFREWVADASTKLTPVKTLPDDPAQIFFTSGTTGDPKGVVQPHRTVLGHQYIGMYGREYHHDDLLYHIGGFTWAGGFNNLMQTWAIGAPMVKYDGKFDPEICLELLEKYNVDLLMSPPTALRGIMDLGSKVINSYDIDLRVLATGGERVSVDILEWAEATLDLFATTMWGQTEGYGIGWPAMGSEHKNKLGTAGKALPGFEAAILDEAGVECDPGEMGQLAIRREDNPTLFLKYLDDPKATEAAQHGPWHLTGDAAYVDEDGYYWIEGRMDDIIISSGYRLSPNEIEFSLAEHPAVLQSAVVGIDDERQTNTVEAFVVLSSDYAESDELRIELQSHVKDNLAKFQYPNKIWFVDDIPTTATGKIKRQKLKEHSTR